MCTYTCVVHAEVEAELQLSSFRCLPTLFLQTGYPTSLDLTVRLDWLLGAPGICCLHFLNTEEQQAYATVPSFFSHTPIRIQGVELRSLCLQAKHLRGSISPGSRRGVFEQTVLLIGKDNKLGGDN